VSSESERGSFGARPDDASRNLAKSAFDLSPLRARPPPRVSLSPDAAGLFSGLDLEASPRRPLADRNVSPMSAPSPGDRTFE